MESTYQSPHRTEGWEREIYPMPAFPTLAVSDLERSWRWYQDTLGFADVFTMRGHDGTPYLAHLRWCRYGDVLLVPERSPVDGARGQGVTLNFAATNADEIAERARAAGAEQVLGPLDRPWNTRDVTILDPDGYRLNFTAPLPKALEGNRETFEAAMARVRDSLPGTR